ncbi:MAG: ribulokinase [Eubacteriales bacterium]|jgi:L-ribulokinase
MGKYTLGLDFGTLSGRALLVDTENGREVATVAMDYPHGVMDRALPDGTPLGTDWALQHPGDYIQVLGYIVPEVLRKAGVSPEDVVGVGVDFTTCTLLPVKADGTPLCFLPQYASEPHAYVKLWKHHAAQKHATRMTNLAAERGERFAARYGGRFSSEWAFPKVWQTLAESPEVYRDAVYFLEAGDWLVWQLTGVQVRNAAMAGYKAFWSPSDGYPSRDFFAALAPELADVTEKFAAPVIPSGTLAGYVTDAASSLTGLRKGTAVAAAHMDAHVTLPAVKITEPGKLCEIMGTSGCHITLDEHETIVPGFCGVAADGAVPGYYALEAGQCCVGDHFAWFAENCVPEKYEIAARERGLNIHAYLTELAEKLAPGESGLVALDWWNGNRSVLVDAELTGLIVGMTLRTKPEEIYRALIEATAYGTRVIVEAFRDAGVRVDTLIAAGGIAQKNPMVMQIYADVLGMPIRVGASQQACALGSAIFAAVCGGVYKNVGEAAERMGALSDLCYTPDAEAMGKYEKLFREYKELHDYFGRGGNDVMRRLRTNR